MFIDSLVNGNVESVFLSPQHTFQTVFNRRLSKDWRLKRWIVWKIFLSVGITLFQIIYSLGGLTPALSSVTGFRYDGEEHVYKNRFPDYFGNSNTEYLKIRL